MPAEGTGHAAMMVEEEELQRSHAPTDARGKPRNQETKKTGELKPRDRSESRFMPKFGNLSTHPNADDVGRPEACDHDDR
jgi:hypothetical protein